MASDIDFDAYEGTRIGLCCGFLCLTLIFNLLFLFKIFKNKQWFYRPRALVVVSCIAVDIASIFSLIVWGLYYLKSRADLDIEISCELIVVAEIFTSFLVPVVLCSGLVLIAGELIIRNSLFGDDERLVSPLSVLLAVIPLVVGGLVGFYLPYSDVEWDECGLRQSSYNLSIYVCSIGSAGVALAVCLIINIFPPSMTKTLRMRRKRSPSSVLLHAALTKDGFKKQGNRFNEDKADIVSNNNVSAKRDEEYLSSEENKPGTEQAQDIFSQETAQDGKTNDSVNSPKTHEDYLKDTARADDVSLEFMKGPTVESDNEIKILHGEKSDSFHEEKNPSARKLSFAVPESVTNEAETDLIYRQEMAPFSSIILVLLLIALTNAILVVPWDIYFLTFEFRGTSLTPVGHLVLREVLVWLSMARPVVTPLVWFFFGFRKVADEKYTKIYSKKSNVLKLDVPEEEDNVSVGESTNL